MALIPLEFGASDPAASTGGAALLRQGTPDTTDVPGYQFPFPVKIVGISLECNPSAGDTVLVQANLAAAGMAGPSATAAHVATAPSSASWWGGDLDAVAVPANTLIQLFYKTTTGTTYTANDVFARIYVRGPAGPSVEYSL